MVVAIFFLAFVAAGLAVVPSFQQANADELNLLKNSKDKKPKKNPHDSTIDEPVIKLVKNDKPKNPNHKGGCSACE
jgi:hypothetical protein